MDEVREKMKNFLINSDTSGIELGAFLAGREFSDTIAKSTSPLAPHLALLSPCARRAIGKWFSRPWKALLWALVVLAVAAGAIFTIWKRTGTGRVLLLATTLFANEDCILTMPSQLQKAFRPPESCGFCREISTGTVPRLANISPEEFSRQYAYRGGPVIVTDATTNWTAPDRFDYWFFQRLYDTHGRGPRAERCQFFPYATGFRNILEALDLPPARVRYEPGTEPWYFGWSNCDPAIVKVLREHYDRPYFLPPDSENNAIDWVFMGGPGLGAHMHVDNVRLPSWQSQLKGAKEWILAPPPECLYQCEFLSVVVQTGETIVLDTNKWYHKTNVLPGPISITVGAEYD
uniref:Cupin-like domain-containing protein n=1 Tax=Anopheles atroparvus TaxID=41427 RepID=A0A182IS25_ANOAO